MSKLLVCAVDQPGPRRYRQGDIVVRYPDTYQFQASEGLPAFWQITVTSLLDTDEAILLEPVNDPIFLVPILLRRRKRFLDVTQLSQQAQNSIAANGTATILRLGLLNALALRG